MKTILNTMSISEVYSDLHTIELNRTITKLKVINNKLLNSCNKLQEDIRKLCCELTSMKKINTNLENNISGLFHTSKLEIERKDRIIAELQSKLDNFIFKRRTGYIDNASKRLANETCSEPPLKKPKISDRDLNVPKQTSSKSRSKSPWRRSHSKHRYRDDKRRRDSRSQNRDFERKSNKGSDSEYQNSHRRPTENIGNKPTFNNFKRERNLTTLKSSDRNSKNVELPRKKDVRGETRKSHRRDTLTELKDIINEKGRAICKENVDRLHKSATSSKMNDKFQPENNVCSKIIEKELNKRLCDRTVCAPKSINNPKNDSGNTSVHRPPSNDNLTNILKTDTLGNTTVSTHPSNTTNVDTKIPATEIVPTSHNQLLITPEVLISSSIKNETKSGTVVPRRRRCVIQLH